MVHEETLEVGVLASSRKSCQVIRAAVIQSGRGRVQLELIGGGIDEDDPDLHRMVSLNPGVILVDLPDRENAIEALRVLNNQLPAARLVLCCSRKDPELLVAAVRSGAREFLPKPVTAKSIREAFDRFPQEAPADTLGPGRNFTVLSAKGGAGATSVAINLAFTFARFPDERVCLVDLARPVGDVNSCLTLRHDHSIEDVFSQTDRLDRMLLDSFMTVRDGVSILPGFRRPAADSADLADFSARLFQVTRTAYSKTLVDFSSALTFLDLETVSRLSSDILLVLVPELPAVSRASSLVRSISEAGGSEKLRVILNRSHRDDTLRESEIEDVLGHPVYWSIPNNYRAVVDAINSGKALVTVNNNGVSHSYRQLAQKLTGTLKEQKRRSFVAMFAF